MTTLLAPPRRGTRSARHTRVDSLDGIRALAVCLVVAFHLDVPGMDGGFLGVDVFFVLSGYLITTLLMRELIDKGRIDLGGFWLRRVLRLLPASMLLILVVVAVSMVSAPAFRRADIGADAFWSLVYAGNWRFIHSSGYFSDDGATSPLLHMWSLAVEEQFYVLWPLLLVAVVAGPVRRMVPAREAGGDAASRAETTSLRRALVRRYVAVLSVVLVVASAVWFQVLWEPESPDRAYMGTDTRAFSPLIGAVAAAAMQHRPVQIYVTRHAQALMIGGLVALALGVALLGRPGHPHPAYFLGGAVAFAVICAVLVAAATTGDRRRGITLILGSTPLGYLGRISYGVYLWHWPLAVWLLPSGPFDPLRALLVAVLTVAAADLSYRYLEHPLRRGALSRAAPRRLLPSTFVVIGVGTLAASALGGTPWNAVVPAVAGDRAGSEAVVVVGDSVIQRLMPALDAEAQARGITVLSGARGGCPALAIMATDENGVPLADGNCRSQVQTQQDNAIEAAHPGVVVWWSRYEIADRLGHDGTFLRAGSPQFWAAQLADLRRAVDRLTAGGAHLVIVETDRPGVGLATRCVPEKCPGFLERMRDEDELRAAWNEHLRVLAARDDRVDLITMDDLYCRDADSPCDDRLPVRDEKSGVLPPPREDLARPDGSHFGDTAAPDVARTLLDRVAAVR